MTTWKPVVGYEDCYMVSDTGEIKSNKSGTWERLKVFPNKKGYMRINLMNNGKLKQRFVHRLVVEAFVRPLDRTEPVNHIDGRKDNNNILNLEIVSSRENILHSVYVLGNQGRKVYMLDKETFEPIRLFPTIRTGAREVGACEASVKRVCDGERNFAGGYSWCYETEYDPTKTAATKLKKLHSRRKKIAQIDPKTNEVIEIYQGINLTKEITGITTISHALRGLTKMAGGYIWEYVE